MFYQAENIELSLGANTLTDFKIKLDERYDKAIAVQLITSENGGDNAFEFGIEAQRETLHPLVHHQDFEHKGGGYLEGMKPIDIPCDGQSLDLRIKPSKTLTANLKAQVIFVLDREEK